MLRASGLIITLVLVLLIVAFRDQANQRAERLLAGEAAAHRTVSALVRASRLELDQGDPHPGLAAIMHAADGLQAIPELSDGQIGYARDASYIYGLSRTSTVLEDGRAQHGYVLRAWPVEYGGTGDVEYHVREDGNLWIGQNQKGRSGVERGFPPPYPEPDISEARARWWRRRLVDEP